MLNTTPIQSRCEGSFTHIDNETFYKISNVDAMPPFFISVVSDSNHWLFAASTGGLTMGRVSPEYAVFPYTTVDKIYESTPHTGPKTIFRVGKQASARYWEPFNQEHDDRFSITRNLYKSVLGNVLRFEEINHDLQLAFTYTWRFSDSFGFSRYCELTNLGDASQSVAFVDGLQNILPAGTPRYTQTQSSNLVDAYKWSERIPDSSLALYSLYSAITDRAEPAESLRATTVFSLGLSTAKVHLNSACIQAFKQHQSIDEVDHSRGVRGSYLLEDSVELSAGQVHSWSQVINVEQSQTQIVALQQQLQTPASVASALSESFSAGSDSLARIMAAADGFQLTGEPVVALHHYANTLFNVMRGGIFANQYQITRADLIKTIAHFNKPCFERNKEALLNLPEAFSFDMLKPLVDSCNDAQLSRLVGEYLPITFGRRHGDPSRPWNQFAIELTDEHGDPLLSYQGNWRDIFQNWEALSLSYPEFIESIIAKFVNASTVDGYNPYRITKQGIDWEVEEPDDPWSYIGYWGDHQIIYLLKLLETSSKFHPQTLLQLLHAKHYSYANVPYRIKDFDKLVEDPKSTVLFDNALAEMIEHRVETLGADGKLLLDNTQNVYQVNLMEKLMVPLLTKLSNLVVDGGIWLNTQRPEWNDANNALVGQGLSMVTLYYMNRYIIFMQHILKQLDATEHDAFEMTKEVAHWLGKTTEILTKAALELPQGKCGTDFQYQLLSSLGKIASEYRSAMYTHNGEYTQTNVAVADISQMLEHALLLIRHSIEQNKKASGLYHAYNILSIDQSSLSVDYLYDMLEGQVAALSSGALSPAQANVMLNELFRSDMYRTDQKTFMLYPDRAQQKFLSKNVLKADTVAQQPLLQAMVDNNDTRIIERDSQGHYRFNSGIINANVIKSRWLSVVTRYPELTTESALQQLLGSYEAVFNHAAFTGRSGGMFGFEGLGCIYWHMVSKLLLSVQEVTIYSHNQDPMSTVTQDLIAHYYRVREGIGFNKTPDEYGAFPADPYSHTPKHAGAQQPGMTGQVKEEVITRLAELGGFVEGGVIRFDPFMLREQEFTAHAKTFRYVDINEQWQTIDLPASSLAFTWCQVPITYTLSNDTSINTSVALANNDTVTFEGGQLSTELSQAIFKRTGHVKSIAISLPTGMLYTA